MKIPDIKLIFVMILGCFFISACDVRYRYPCQNPENWDKDFCKKPICEVSRDCPEHIFKGQEAGLVTYSSPTPNNCTQCKGDNR
jgi:hypothetical protein